MAVQHGSVESFVNTENEWENENEEMKVEINYLGRFHGDFLTILQLFQPLKT